MDKNVKVSILLDLYGKLLTEKQYKFLDDYYNNDLSLSEIAENENITRQAVRDNLKNGENNLLSYEEKLKLMEKTKIINEIISKIDNASGDEKDILKDIKTKLKSLN